MDENFSLPIISIAPYLSPAIDDATIRLRRETSAALHDACLKFGFFYLDISAYADMSETDELTRLAREFFALPQAEKDLLSLKNEDNARGGLHACI
jgi:isopenicillin N synthase-like dioxygenase